MLQLQLILLGRQLLHLLLRFRRGGGRRGRAASLRVPKPLGVHGDVLHVGEGVPKKRVLAPIGFRLKVGKISGNKCPFRPSLDR